MQIIYMFISTLIDGPIVEDICTFFMNSPLDDDGLAFVKTAMTSSKFSANLVSSNETFLIDKCTLPNLSFLISTFPFLKSSTAFATLGVTVPVFGLGISP